MPISSYKLISVPQDTDIFWVEQGGADYRITRSQIVADVASDLAAEIATTDAEITALQTGKLALSGGTMTGLLTLSGAPTTGLHAATKTYTDAADALKADLASPTLTGTPAAPTAADGTNTTQIATTAFVLNQIDEYMFERTAITGASATLTEDQAGIIGVNRAGAVALTLPTISTLSDAKRVFYLIKDEGFNANATSQVITINRGGSDTIENAGTSTTITTAGESVYLYNDGSSSWFIGNVDTQASATATGVVELATTAEAQALTDTARVITCETLGDVLDDSLYKATELGAASKTLAEADNGLWYVTYTSTGSVAITLPDPSGLSDATKAVYSIVDSGGDAVTNNIVITSGGSATINGATSFTIDANYTGATFFTNGTNWFTREDSSTAATVISGTTNYLPKIDSTGAGLTDSLILDDGDQLAFNSSIHSTSFANMTNSSFRRSLRVNNTGTATTNEAIEGNASGAGTSNYAFYGSATNAGTNVVLYAGDTAGGTTYAFTDCALAGGATTTYGHRVSSSCNSGTVYGGHITLSGASTENTALRLSATGATTNNSLEIINGDIDLSTNAIDIILDTSTGTKIGTATSQKLGFYNATPVVQPTALTTAETTLTNAGTASDYAIQAMTNSSPFGFVTQAEGETVVEVVLNNQARINEIETKLQALGLLA